MSDQVYTVEKIMKKRLRKGKTEYFVRWKDWDPVHDSWEPAKNILDRNLIEDFEKRNKSKNIAINKKSSNFFKNTNPDVKTNAVIERSKSQERNLKKTTNVSGKRSRPAATESDNEQSSSGQIAPRKKRELSSKLFPEESGKIGVTISPSTTDNNILKRQTLANLHGLSLKGQKMSETGSCDLFAEYVGMKLKDYNDRTRSIVQHMINNVLFEADMGKLLDVSNPANLSVLRNASSNESNPSTSISSSKDVANTIAGPSSKSPNSTISAAQTTNVKALPEVLPSLAKNTLPSPKNKYPYLVNSLNKVDIKNSSPKNDKASTAEVV